MKQNFASAPGAELREQLVKANSALTVRMFIGGISERDQAVGRARKVRSFRFEAAEELLRVVGHITLSVDGSTNQEGAAALKDAGVEVIHHSNRHLMACCF